MLFGYGMSFVENRIIFNLTLKRVRRIFISPILYGIVSTTTVIPETFLKIALFRPVVYPSYSSIIYPPL